MKPKCIAERWPLLLLAGALAINAWKLLPETVHSAALWRRTSALNLEERYRLLYPQLYADIERLRERIPESATLWVVSPYDPHHANYYLYPRTLRWGSKNLNDRDRLKSQHLNDWLLTNASPNPQEDRLGVIPPATSSR
jgi:hypothetical protein